MLLEVQQAFATAIRKGAPGAALAHIAGPAVAARARLAVYLRHHRASLVAVIAEGFPAAGRLVGQRFLATAADAFIALHPPASPVLALYGAAFPAFLANWAPCAAIPWIGDVARAEWAMQEASRAPASATLDAGALAAAGLGETSRLALEPTARIIESAWPLAGLLRAGLGGDLPDAPLAPAPSAVLIRRGDDGVTFTALPAATGAFLAALAASATLEAAAARALDTEPAFDLAAAFRLLGTAQLVARVLPGVPTDA